MKLKNIFFCAMLFMTVTALADSQKVPSFPGAEGYGRYTTGGRGGKVYHVTNLNDSGDGSLRWALSQPGPRTIVFDVDGTIHLNSKLQIPAHTTIAGQTAPGDGICVADYPFLIHGQNIIIRYMRIRLGSINAADCDDSWDGFGGFDYRDLIIDHCSVSWSFDECLSVLGNINTTVQWCLVAQSMVNVGHSKGNHGYGGNWGGSGASFHHNLIAHHTSRTPRLGPRPSTQLDERMDMRNNVIYNWGGNGCYGGEGMKVNIVNNYYKPGPATLTLSNVKQQRIAAVGVRTNEYVAQYPAYAPALHLWGKYYVTGNTNTKWPSVDADNWGLGFTSQVDAGACDGTWTKATRDSIKLTEPIAFVHTTTHNAADAYARVAAYVGASKGRDAFDAQIISDLQNGTATATGSGLSSGFINTQNDNTAIIATYGSAWPTLNSGTAKADTDGDGMPDEWESTNGLNPNDAADGNATTLSAEGYTNLEVYMNSLVADITAAQNDGGTVEGQDDVPQSLYDSSDDNKTTSYSIQNEDSNVGPGMSITSVNGITLTFDNADWTIGGSKSAATTVDGVNFTGKYATTTSTGNFVSFATTASGELTIFLGGGIATNKTVEMVEGETGLTGYVLSTGAEIASGTNPAVAIDAYDGIKYNLESGKTYNFRATGTKWRLAGFRYITNESSGITSARYNDIKSESPLYNLNGIEVTNPSKGIYIQDGKKIIVK